MVKKLSDEKLKLKDKLDVARQELVSIRGHMKSCLATYKSLRAQKKEKLQLIRTLGESYKST